MSKVLKVLTGFTVLLLMTVLMCATAFADNNYIGTNTWFSVLGRDITDHEGWGYMLRFAPYTSFSFDITWVDDGNIRLRPTVEQAEITIKTSNGVGNHSQSFPLSLDSGLLLVADGSHWFRAGVPQEDTSTKVYIAWRGTTGFYVPGATSETVDELVCIINDASNWKDIDGEVKSKYGADAYAKVELYDYIPQDLVGYRASNIIASDDILFEPAYTGSKSWWDYSASFSYVLAPYVRFTDGVDDEEIFVDQVVDINSEGDYLYLHDATPQSQSMTRGQDPVREGYDFVGWRLTTGPDKDGETPGGVRPTVEASQMDDHAPFVVYEAVWKEASDESPKLAITKTASKTTVSPGDEVVYTVTVSNVGDAEAVDVTVTDVLDSRLVFQSYQLGAQGAVNISQPADSIYHIGNISSGDSVELYITVKVADGTPDCSIKNKAVATRSS